MNKYNFKLNYNPARQGEDNWEIVHADDIEFWKNSIPLISDRNYEHNDCKISVRINWKPLIAKLKNHYKYMIDIYGGNHEASKKYGRKTNISAVVEITGQNSLSEYSWYPGFFIEQYCYEVFLLLNLSRPGVCDFFSLSIKNREKYKEKVRLSSFNFEFAWDESNKGKFPKLSEIPLPDVISWYERMDIGIRQKASSDIEKSIFSLYHICKLDGDVSDIVWVFHALESLFTTRVGEGFSILVKRISYVLGLNSKDASILKKKLRKLNDMRSSLIHGGYEVYHPARGEVIDPEISDQYYAIYENMQFGSAIIISCIQAMIKNNWYGIDVEEKVKGHILP